MQFSTIRAKKHLGQHFLKDQNIALKIVDSLETDGCQSVLEIGPGTGVLTGLLEKKVKDLWLIEIDRESSDFLNIKYPELQNKLITADFLKFNFPDDFPERFCIIGNFPYNISSQIFFRILEHKNRIPQVVCMIQKEVAQRIASIHGNKVYGILSVLLQTFYKIDYLFTVSEQVFDPPPRVKSAVIRLTRNERQTLDCSEDLFFRLVKTAFNQRRKTLRNSLKSLQLDLPQDNPVFLKRPEQLSVEELIELTKLIENSVQHNRA
jgi:16S rRNA (adenine1518-N6/adenine1519-N6)-dimethyltransferase